MTQYVYMNECIKQAKPKRPVIVCQRMAEKTEANLFTLRVGNKVIGTVVFDKGGLDACTTHDVTAWLALEDDVDVIPEAEFKPAAASAKIPNKPVKFR